MQVPPMQNPAPRRTNLERSGATRAALLQAARPLFTERGYAATSTPDIVAAAGITRGALYHHFADKRDLFRALLQQEASAVAEAIEAACPPKLGARQALQAGSAAYLAAMALPGRTRLLLIEGPAALGVAEMQALDEAHAERSLRDGLAAALAERRGQDAVSVYALTQLLSAAFDRAAIAIEQGADAAEYAATLATLIDRVLGPSRGGTHG